METRSLPPLFAVLLSTVTCTAQAAEPPSCGVLTALAAKYEKVAPELRPREGLLAAGVAVGLTSHILTEASAAKIFQEQSALVTQLGSDAFKMYERVRFAERGLERARKLLALAEGRRDSKIPMLAEARKNLAAAEAKLAAAKGSVPQLLEARTAELEFVQTLEGFLESEASKIVEAKQAVADWVWRLGSAKTVYGETVERILQARLFGYQFAGALSMGGKILGRAAVVLTVLDILSTPGDTGITEDRMLVDPLDMRRYAGEKNPYLRNPLALLALDSKSGCEELKKDHAVEMRFLELASHIVSSGTKATLDPRVLVEAAEKKAPAAVAPLSTPMPPATCSSTARPAT